MTPERALEITAANGCTCSPAVHILREKGGEGVLMVTLTHEFSCEARLNPEVRQEGYLLHEIGDERDE